MTRPPVRGDDDWEEGPALASPEPPPAGAGDAWPDHRWAGHGHDGDGEAWGAGNGGDASWEGEGWDGDEWEEVTVPANRGRRVAAVVAGLLAVVVLLAAVAFVVVRGRLDPSGPPGEEVRVTIATGSTNADIARLLADEGVVPDALAFEWYLRVKGAEGFQAGDYLFRERSAVWDALAVLDAQPLPPEFASFTVPEGLTIRQYPANIVDDLPAFSEERLRQLLAAGQVPRPAAMGTAATTYEGFLFPDTYQVGEGMDELDVLTLMTAHFDRVAAEIGLEERAADLGLTPYEVVVVASLIQQEYGIPEEMPKIARVIYNRLEVGEPLGIDATSRYEAELAGRDRNDIDFTSDSPYNTRRRAGLPPTPIAAPGRAALEAALAPAEGPWTYYVLDPDETRTPPGGHFFTDSAAEFQRVKADCREAGLGCG